MSLAVKVAAQDSAGAVGETVAIAGLMTGTLVMAATEVWQEGLDVRHWLLPLACALACTAWCLMLVARGRRRPAWVIRIAPDGALALQAPEGGQTVAATVTAAIGLGHLIYLRVKPMVKVDFAPPPEDDRQSVGQEGIAPGSVDGSPRRGLQPCGRFPRDCHFLLARRSFSVDVWHGLRRWLVWYRRCGHPESVNAFRVNARSA